MTFKTAINAGLGLPTFDINSVDTVAKVPVGTIARATDDSGLGDADFIYLPGAANCAANDIVEYDLLPGGQTITRHSNATASNSGRPLAVAVVPVVANQFGWFQISGVAVVNAVAGTVAGVAMGTATVGSIGNTADAGDQILGMRISSAVGTPAAGKVYATMNRPFVQGQIT